MPSTSDTQPEPQWLCRAIPILIVVLAAVHLYVPPSRVAELEVVPDSVEYAVAGHQFATTGKYEIQVNGQALPPRYPPGFSVLFLAPIYSVAPNDLGNGIFAVWLSGIVAVLFAYLIANKLAGSWAGVLAAVLLLQHRQFAAYTQVIMTDVPAVALGLIACGLYLRIALQPTPSMRLYLVAGVIVALSIAIRPLTGLLVLPFLFDIFTRRKHGVWGRVLILAFPCALVIAGTSLYQWHAFGDWRRTGYQFWLAVPYDYFAMTFSPRYLKDNLAIARWNLVWAPILLGLVGAALLWQKKTRTLPPIGVFLFLAVIPLSVIHLFYFFTDIRFHFLGLGLGLVLAGAGVATIVPENFKRRFWPVLPILALTILVPRIAGNPLQEGTPIRNRVATVAAAMLPQNAILISRIDPAYLEQRVARGTARRILPFDRKTPYANAVLSAHRIARLDPPPHNAADHACPGLVRGGATQLYVHTADEEVEQIRAWVAEGVPVYLEVLSSESDEASRAQLTKSFHAVPMSAQHPWMLRLEH